MDPVTVVHETSPNDRMMRLLQMQQGGGMGRQPKSNPALAVAGAAGFLGGGCVLAGGIVQAVLTPALAAPLGGTYATDVTPLNAYLAANTTAQFTSGVLYAIGGGLGVVAGGAGVVAGMVRR